MNPSLSIPNAHRLPPAAEPFFDREAEARALIDFLAPDREPRLAAKIGVIAGGQGSGKTALCAAAANRLRQDYVDGPVYIKTQAAGTGEKRLANIFEIVIHRFDPLARLADDLESLQRQYLAALNDKKVLLVLDDFASAADLQWVIPPPSCGLLITAEDPLEVPEAIHVHLAGLSAGSAEKLVTQICPWIGDQAQRLAALCQHNPLYLRLLAGLLAEHPQLELQGCLAALEPGSPPTAGAEPVDFFAVLMDILLQQLPLAQKQWLFQLAIIPDGFKPDLAAELAKNLPGGLDSAGLSQVVLEPFVRMNFLSSDPGHLYYRMPASVQDFILDSIQPPASVWSNLAKVYAGLATEITALANESADGFLLSLWIFDDHKSHFKKIIQYLRGHPDKSLEEARQNIYELVDLFGACRFLPASEIAPLSGSAGDFNFEPFEPEKTKIILTGFMGTGKTTVGKLLADALQYRFIDTDDLIEAQYGGSIADIFARLGEEAFREMERRIVREIGALESVVISTGGRLMLDPENAQILGRGGRVFCLVATPEEILTRVSHDTSHTRPLLSVPNPKERIVELLHARNDKYRRFPQIVTDQKEPTFLARNLIEFLHTSPESFVVENPQNRYEYVVGAGLLPFIRQLCGIEGEIVIVTDTVVEDLYGPSLASTGQIIAIPVGRQHKTLATVQFVYDRLLESGLDRAGTVVALGGSVVGDIAGYAAATYMRGINFVQCPTSLIAMVDTSVGGKTAIDLPQGKNIVGVYKQPSKIIADVATLQTLSPSDYASGMAEIVKYAILVESDLLEQLENGHLGSNWSQSPAYISELQRLVAQAIAVKINIVQLDPFEGGLRKILNLGHTFAYALEQVSHNSYRHGEAVSIGLVAAANLSARLGYCDTAIQNRLETLLGRFGLPTRFPSNLTGAELLRAMQRDKKKQAGRLTFILLSALGHAFISDEVPNEEILATVAALAG